MNLWKFCPKVFSFNNIRRVFYIHFCANLLNRAILTLHLRYAYKDLDGDSVSYVIVLCHCHYAAF